MLKLIALALLAVVGGVLVVAAVQPDTFVVQRSATIAAEPARIFPLINDLERFNAWNPYAKKDPQAKGSYSAVTAGKGAAYAFEGNSDVGKGRIRITEAIPASAVTMALEMIEPFEASNVVEFVLEPKGGRTEVTWRMKGRSPYLARVMCLFFDMDAMVGRDFETGLASLKALAEK